MSMENDFRPTSAIFFPGFGASAECELSKAFVASAAGLGVRAFSPETVDIEGDFTVVPSLNVQATRPEIREGRGADVIIAWSAGVVLASLVYADFEISPNQRLVLLNPSVRNPSGFIDKGRPTDQDDPVEVELASRYAGAYSILPGAEKNGRQIAVSNGYRQEIGAGGYQPPRFMAELLDQFSPMPDSDELRARVLKVRRDMRLGADHELLLGDMREQLAPQARVGVDTIEGTHFFHRQERTVMDTILSGELFATYPNEIWSLAGIIVSSEVQRVSVSK